MSAATCEECERLIALCLAAIANDAEVGDAVAVKGVGWYEAWREATKGTRAACEVAFMDLSRHTAEHGCNRLSHPTRPKYLLGRVVLDVARALRNVAVRNRNRLESI